MFDLIAGTLDRPFRDKHPGATVFSVAAHIIILGGVIGAALFVMTQGLPEVPTMMAFVADVPAPPPPPPPPPPPAPGPKPAQPATPVPTGGQFTFPVEVPTGITVETGSDTRADEGVPGGVEGGIPGGIVGGIVGGIMTDVAPPALPPPPPPVPQRLGPVRIGGEIKAPALIHRVEPIYPDIAVMAKATGVVILEATIDERGEVTNVVVLRSRKMLDQAAVDAVKQWRYTPLLLNGAPRAFVLTVTLNFSLI
jgi:protein TonB